jgi:hypothetical protein
LHRSSQIQIGEYPCKPVSLFYERKHMLSWIIAWLSVIIVTVGSLQPVRPRLVLVYHHPIHVLMFSAVAFLFFRLSPDRSQIIRSALAICLLGLSLEFYQHSINHHQIEWWDICTDWAGILISFLLYDIKLRYERGAD